jgi:hypothetical protein
MPNFLGSIGETSATAQAVLLQRLSILSFTNGEKSCWILRLSGALTDLDRGNATLQENPTIVAAAWRAFDLIRRNA